MLLNSALISLFLSTPSARRATCDGLHHHLHREDFYPRPLRGGRLPYFFHFVKRFLISIHALCEEGDLAELQNIMMRAISIHALCEEGDGDNNKPKE